jgi:hypothetical protein
METIDTHTTEISVPPLWIQMLDRMKKNNYKPINTPIPVTPTIATVIIPPNASGESVSSSEKQTYDI